MRKFLMIMKTPKNYLPCWRLINLRFACCSFPYFGKSSEHISAEEAFVKLVESVTILFQTEEKTVGDLIEAIRISLKPLTHGVHCFTQKWLHWQLDILKRNRKAHEILVKQYFAESYTIVTNSAMSTYWTEKTLNIHIKVVERNVNSQEIQLYPAVEVY